MDRETAWGHRSAGSARGADANSSPRRPLTSVPTPPGTILADFAKRAIFIRGGVPRDDRREETLRKTIATAGFLGLFVFALCRSGAAGNESGGAPGAAGDPGLAASALDCVTRMMFASPTRSTADSV